jgi:SAM-dependent methyltransferase
VAPRYDSAYLERVRVGAQHSAEVIVPLVLEIVRPRTVIDVGCGLGTWLKVFEEHGIFDYRGVDGDYVDPTELEIPPERFFAADLSDGVTVDRRFDLAVSLEVAEHLPPESAETFVGSLTRLAPAVLFSAAIPKQGGTGHVNEQWPEYWAGLFGVGDYVAIDCLRPKIWRNPEVEKWYAQNTLLFVERHLLARDSVLRREYEHTLARPLALVHPRMLEWAFDNPWYGVELLSKSRNAGLIAEEDFQRRIAMVQQRLDAVPERPPS